MATTSEMKRPFMLGMKTGDDKYRVFHIIDWKVRGEFDVTPSSCDCTMYRFSGECSHSRFVTEDVVTLATGRFDTYDYVEDLPPSDWKDQPAFAKIVVWSEEDGLARIMGSKTGDVGLSTLAELFSEGTCDLAASDFERVLNPKRIYAECMAAMTGSLDIRHADVSHTGEAITPAEYEVEASDPIEEVTPEPTPEPKPDPVDIESLPVWDYRKTPKPDDKQFYVDTEVWQQILYSLSTGKNVLLTGPSGSGKSELAYIAAKALDSHLEAFNMGAMSEPRTSLIGNTHFNKEKGTWFDESRFAKTVQNEDGVVLLDEITRSEPGAFNILMPLMDRQGYLPLDESEDGHVIRRGERVAFIATANVGMEYSGTMAMDKALKDRFAVTIDMDFPPEANEVTVLTGRCEGLKKSDAKQLVKIAARQRELCRIDGEFIEMISTRMLIEAAEQIAAGVEFRTACKFCIENQFSADGGDASDRTKIQQIIQKDMG